MVASSAEANVESLPDDRGSGAAPAAAWAFAFLLLRLFAVSGYDWNTAFAVSTTLSLNDAVALLFGSLMAGYLLVAILLVVVLPLLVAAVVWARNDRRPAVVLFATLGLVVLVALTASFGLWWLPVAGVALLAILAVIRRLPAEHRLRRAFTAAMARVGSVAAVGVLVVAAFLQTPWVPQEKIETVDGTVTGYVLSVDSGYLNVLTDDHEFVILLSADVLSRE